MDSTTEKVDLLPYAKPKLRSIALVAEEVLATGCKQAPGAPGKFFGAVSRGCDNTSCKVAGGS